MNESNDMSNTNNPNDANDGGEGVRAIDERTSQAMNLARADRTGGGVGVIVGRNRIQADRVVDLRIDFVDPFRRADDRRDSQDRAGESSPEVMPTRVDPGISAAHLVRIACRSRKVLSQLVKRSRDFLEVAFEVAIRRGLSHFGRDLVVEESNPVAHPSEERSGIDCGPSGRGVRVDERGRDGRRRRAVLTARDGAPADEVKTDQKRNESARHRGMLHRACGRGVYAVYVAAIPAPTTNVDRRIHPLAANLAKSFNVR